MSAVAFTRILSFEDARRTIEEHQTCVQPVATEVVELLQAGGRVLADPIFADRDFPPFPRSTRDGYAVRSADLSRLPATLAVIGEIKAGEKLTGVPLSVGAGEAVSIMTGAPVPPGADAVVMVEYTVGHGAGVEIGRSAAPGENIVPQGAESKQGSLLLDRGQRLSEAAIGLAASVGKAQLTVYKRPRVALLATGDEIVEVAVTPGPTQIRNSNSYSLAVQVRAAGGEPILLPIAPDEPRALRRLIAEGLQSDLLILAGGVSMGRYDLVEQVLAEIGAEFFFTGAKIQPGAPAVFGRCKSVVSGGSQTSPKHTYFFGLPGNPVSTMVTFEVFARPLLEALAGQTPRELGFLHARLKSEIRVKPGLKRILPAVLAGQFENSEVELVAWQGSGDMAALARSNCYVVVPENRDVIRAGEWVAVMIR